jgi:hypothetical protein
VLADASGIDCALRPCRSCFSLAETPPEARS